MNPRKPKVAAIQYAIGPISSFEEFEAQVRAQLQSAREQGCDLAVLPEYFSTQLLCLGGFSRPIHEQIRWLADQEERIREFVSSCARKLGLYVVAGTTPVWSEDRSKILNRCLIFSPSGERSHQDKLYITRFEVEDWLVSAGGSLRVFETELGKFAVLICYDAEFPELARLAARQGAEFLIVPSCTDDRMGFLRVRYCAHARAVENQLYVVHSGTVGSLPQIPAVALHYGQASILTPSDSLFPNDGILAQSPLNQEAVLVGELDLDLIAHARRSGTVLNWRDHQAEHDWISKVDLKSL